MNMRNSVGTRIKQYSGISTPCTKMNHKASRLGRKGIRVRLYRKNRKSSRHIQTRRIGR